MRRLGPVLALAALVMGGCSSPAPTQISTSVPTSVPSVPTPIPPMATLAPPTTTRVPPSPTPTPTHIVGKQMAVGSGFYTNIAAGHLKMMLEKKDFVFINVHIPYAGEIANTDAFIAYNDIDKNLDKLPADKNARIVLYCRSGSMSKTASETLVKLGFTNIFELDGGMNAWQGLGLPLLNSPK